MIRFPNPGSDIPSFIRIFKVLHTYMSEKSWFTLDDMSDTLTKMNLAASSGHVGERALALSTREDRSRDPLYNQSKMYAELFRTLGWMVSDDPKAALIFCFTLLGDHVAVADIDPKAIFEESVLGINYPNKLLAIKGTEASRAFSAILRTALRLNAHICRDEIIIGILNMDDTGEEGIENIVSEIAKLRGSASRLSKAIIDMSKRINIQINTMQNYTRFPLAVLTYCDWFDRIFTKEFYPDGRPTVMFKLTPYGKHRAEQLDELYDVRLSDFESHTTDEQAALVRIGFYSMLQRANFDISPAIAQVAKDRDVIRQSVEKDELIFSPYQTIRPEIVDSALGYARAISPEIGRTYNQMTLRDGESESIYKVQQVTTIKLVRNNSAQSAIPTDTAIAREIAEFIGRGCENSCIADALTLTYRNATKETFYPLVADLFSVIGFNCYASRAGINYERWDAIAVDDSFSIPIEIKSPTEEAFISVKAIRQALENKIILLSRKSYTTDWNTTTLAIGYHLPNERAEVSRLIADVKKTFNVNIGVIDFKALVTMASAVIRGNEENLIEKIRKMEGFINVESF
ncbi:MAG TPA: hypothetical protein DHD79_00250 [Firmicutes bacterium]|nr:hypothetical protein [Bacillota bacterium]